MGGGEEIQLLAASLLENVIIHLFSVAFLPHRVVGRIKLMFQKVRIYIWKKDSIF